MNYPAQPHGQSSGFKQALRETIWLSTNSMQLIETICCRYRLKRNPVAALVFTHDDYQREPESLDALVEGIWTLRAARLKKDAYTRKFSDCFTYCLN